jgi:hypothetical protein
LPILPLWLALGCQPSTSATDNVSPQIRTATPAGCSAPTLVVTTDRSEYVAEGDDGSGEIGVPMRVTLHNCMSGDLDVESWSAAGWHKPPAITPMSMKLQPGESRTIALQVPVSHVGEEAVDTELLFPAHSPTDHVIGRATVHLHTRLWMNGERPD